MLASRNSRPDSTYYQNRAAQWIAVRSILDLEINGQSDEYSVMHHAPNPFSLHMPMDQTLFELEGSTTEEVFTWEEAQPIDPYNNIRISRFDSAGMYSDEVRYKIRIIEAVPLTRAVEFESDNGGRDFRWTLKHHVLYSIINQLSGLPTARRQDMVWLVPFNPGTVIPLELHAAGHCRLHVLDLRVPSSHLWRGEMLYGISSVRATAAGPFYALRFCHTS